MVFSSGRNLLLVVIILTGCVGLIGNAVVSLMFIDPFMKWGPYMYLALFGDSNPPSKGFDIQRASFFGSTIPLAFGLLTCVFWFFGRPTSTSRFVKIFRFVTIFSCILAFAGTCISHACIVHPYPFDYKDDWVPDEQIVEEFMKWLQEKFKSEENFAQYGKNMINKINKLPFQYSIFLCFTAIFFSLSLVYWISLIFNRDEYSRELRSQDSLI